MERNDSKNYKLIKTTDQRPSMKDLNSTRPSNYLDSYLERVTDEVKVPKSVVRVVVGCGAVIRGAIASDNILV